MNDKKTLNVLLVAVYRDLAEDFIGKVASENGNEVTIGSHLVKFDTFAGDPGEGASLEERAAKADIIIVLVRFLDVLSLDKIKNIYFHLSQANQAAKSVFYLREKGELDFKISCPSCGQKLWLRDTDVGKRGRCPNCSKPFVILSQADHLKTQLLLPESLPCFKVIRQDADSFRSAVGKLIESHTSGLAPADVSINREALKHATVRIQVQDS